MQYGKDDTFRKLAYKVFRRFQYTDDRFNGTKWQDIEDVFKTYETASLDYKLSLDLQHHTFHNLFVGEAKRYYCNKVAQYFTEYDESKAFMIQMIQSCNNVTNQNRTRTYLQKISLVR